MAFGVLARERLVAGVLIAGAGLFGSLACSNPPERLQTTQTTQPLHAERAQEPAMELSDAKSAMDRSITEQLRSAIEQDPGLKDREISFSVDNGDVTVTGDVRSETERQRMNELAMHVAGVKSVANALRVSPS